jgi:hypothetical protein
VIVALGFLTEATASAGSFDITAPSTSAQTLGPRAGQTGTIESTGSLTVSGGTNAVTISGNDATLTNLGTLEQTGTGRAIRDNTGVTGLTITNGSTTNSTALMQTADGDVIQMNKSPASVTLNNYGSMISLNASAGGSQVVDFNAILSGANTVNNFAGAVMQASEADAVRPGVNGVVNNAGTVKIDDNHRQQQRRRRCAKQQRRSDHQRHRRPDRRRTAWNQWRAGRRILRLYNERDQQFRRDDSGRQRLRY